MPADRPFLLIHGGLHGGWCWDGTIAALAARNRRAVTFDLPGHGADQTPRANVGITDYVSRAVDALERLDGPATVVCHSMGGLVGTALADARPDRVAALIYVAAVVPDDGDSLSADEPGVSHVVDRSEAEYFFYHDCDPVESQAASLKLTPQPVRPLIEPVRLAQERLRRVPKAYIRCLKDRVLSQERQRFYAERHSGTLDTAIDTGHSPFLAKRDELVTLLLELEATLSSGDPGFKAL